MCVSYRSSADLGGRCLGKGENGGWVGGERDFGSLKGGVCTGGRGGVGVVLRVGLDLFSKGKKRAMVAWS